MRSLATAVMLVLGPVAAFGQSADTLRLAGLGAPVEIVRDRYGINHIYAQNEADLFFAQGWAAARDRLFQFELFRRQATGTIAEILGERELKRDIGARLHRFRGDITREMNHYHERGAAIIPAFVRGVNAYIDAANRDPATLPIEFRLLGIRPQHWTPEVLVSRHQGLLGNVSVELATGRAVARIGAALVNEYAGFGPGVPQLALDPAIDPALLEADLLELYDAFRRGVRFLPEDIAAPYRAQAGAGLLDARAASLERSAAHAAAADPAGDAVADPADIGSNNWVVSGRLTATGRPFMANDPHRVIQAPSLRYWVHLVAPGWNVVGGGEPLLPGVSIGHNEHGAWGLTVFDLDGEDLHVYETNPANPEQYRYRGAWEDMRVIVDTIPVKGRAPEIVRLKYTRHGPVLYEDTARDAAVALRAAWLDYGAAPYLASLRMDQARTWEEFREACRYSHIPGENMIWADTSGTIGWQAVGVAPLRRGPRGADDWSGLVPVPGDGRYEWEGYLPIERLPHLANPPAGFWATSNEHVTPDGYDPRRAIGWSWSAPFRGDRVREFLPANAPLTLEHMMRLQHDELSLPARALVPLLAGVPLRTPQADAARRRLLAWDHVLEAGSVAAGIYAAWERRLARNLREALVPDAFRETPLTTPFDRILAWTVAADARFGADPRARRDSLLAASLEQAVADLREKLGDDIAGWRYGQAGYKHVTIRHFLSGAVHDSLRARLDSGPLPRGGYGYTVNMTGGGDNQTSGASFRIITDLSDWDRSVGTNAPGQSGDVRSPHYADLFEPWARGEYFPVAFGREAVRRVTASTTLLAPRR